jgi:hypothetical protein
MYDNIIAVDPLDPNRVWAGGISLFRSDDGGVTWGVAGGLHPDHHVLVFHPQFNGTTNQQAYVGNDGGVWLSANARGAVAGSCEGPPSGAVEWNSINNNYGVTQFYHGLPYPGGATYLGGTQDNGTIRGTDHGGPDAWEMLFGGDGGHVALHPRNADIFYFQSNDATYKTTDGGKTFTSATPGITDVIGFGTAFVMDPSNSDVLWTGTSVPWRSVDGAKTWVQAGSRTQQPSVGSSIAVAPTDSNFVLFGTLSGVASSHTALTDSSSSLWSSTTLAAQGYTSSLTFDPTNKNVAYATFSRFGSPHVWKSVDGGATFVNIDGAGVTGLPDIPVNSIVVDPTDTSHLYIGTDLGVFISLDGGESWAVENTGFANVITESLSITAGHLFAFTHGRGAYRVSLSHSACEDDERSRCPVVPTESHPRRPVTIGPRP